MRYMCNRSILAGVLVAVAFLCAAGLPRSVNARELLPTDRIQFADALYARQMYDLAAEEYESLLEASTTVTNADQLMYRLAESLRLSGRDERAGDYYAGIATTYPDSAYAIRAEIRLAEFSLSAGELSQAAARLDRLIKTVQAAEDAAPVWYLKGQVAAQSGKPDDAVKWYTYLIETYPETTHAAYAAMEMAEVKRQQGAEPGEVLGYYSNVIEKIDAGPVYANALLRIASIQFSLQNYQETVRIYEKWMAQPGVTDAQIRSVLPSVLWAYLKAEQPAKLIELSEGRPVSGSQEDQVLYTRANAYRQLMRYDEAVMAYNELSRSFPDSAYAEAAAYEKALLAYRRNQYDQVEETLVPLEGKDLSVGEEITWLLAESFSKQDKKDEAIERYRRLVLNWPESRRAPQALFKLASIMEDRGEYAPAAFTYRRLAKQYPDNELAPAALLYAAAAMVRVGNIEEAWKEWTRLIENYPKSTWIEEALYKKAMAEIQLERYRLAQQSLAVLAEYDIPEDEKSRAAYWLGVVHERQDQMEKAEVAYRRSIALSPEVEWARKSRERVVAVLQKMDRNAQAVEELLLMLEQNQDVAVQQIQWLVRQAWLQEHDTAVESGSRVLTTGNDPAMRQLGWYYLGRVYLKKARTLDAAEAFSQAVSQDVVSREGIRALLEWAFIALEQQNLEKAEMLLNRAKNQVSEDSMLYSRARSYLGFGRLADARNEYDSAARYFLGVGVLFDDPELVPEALYRAAIALKKAGKRDAAEKTAAELKERYPESRWVTKLAAPASIENNQE